MCIPKEDECPINEVIVDLTSKYDEYISKGHKVAYLQNLTEDYALYYTNTAIDNEIVVKLDFYDKPPKYISEDNFIFDKEYYDKYHSGNIDNDDNGLYDRDDDRDWNNDWDDYWDLDDDSGGGGFRILEEEIWGSKYTTYLIKSLIDSSKNIDRSFKNVSENLYIGNYIGFKDYNNMNKFIESDLYYLYFNPFPNYISNIFCYLSIIFLIILIIFSLCRFFHKDKYNEYYDKCRTLRQKLCIIIPYLQIFIGFFIYIIYSFCFIYIKSNFNGLTQVSADIFIEDLISDVKKRHNKKVFHITVIILFSFSIISFLLAWILSQIFTYRYLKLIGIARGTDTIYRRSI